ncbi:hypothetical protein LTR62_001501 [Meristemomyces frigidus]|uniref:Dipeptidase n=1 Tax=Meristemomyces frigidus TaxID=1508187 RepID=A0AAN7TGI7_9PEZI|nr:hypothetical protein LTR62_001501 [Meristemomyces frigidus]
MSARRPLEEIPKTGSRYPGHVDIPRMREGHLGAAIFSVWTPCPETQLNNFDRPSNDVRDAFEVLDLIQNFIDQQFDHLQFARSSGDIRRAFDDGKIASLIGVEGTHFLGNSLSTVRLLAKMGMRYMTLTHICHSAFASSNGAGGKMRSVHPGNGLTDLGRELIYELNRLGVMIDLSHTSDETATQTVALSAAPVVWTHSGSRTVMDHPRNIPDVILKSIGDGPGKNAGVIQSVFYPPFIGPTSETANLSRVADHIEYVAAIVGRKHVGIASDFDGMYSSVIGLEDASKYPYLVAEMLSRGWTDEQVKNLMGRNILRVMDEVDTVREAMQDKLASTAVWEGRKDLPARWGGAGDAYFPYEVKAKQGEIFAHDEL